MQIEIAPTYEHLRRWIEDIPLSFSTMGEVIYDARNQIRKAIAPDGTPVVIKRYHIPSWYNQIIYTCLRKPKAKRAYENALILNELRINTPTAIGYILCGKGLLKESYLITVQSPLTRNFYEFRHHPLEGYEPIVRQFARFTADMHQKQVLHLDYSPGNILFDTDEKGKCTFTIVDINRMQTGKRIMMQEACKSFRRLWGGQDFFELLASEYATAMDWQKNEVNKLIIRYWQRFWKYRK